MLDRINYKFNLFSVYRNFCIQYPWGTRVREREREREKERGGERGIVQCACGKELAQGSKEETMEMGGR